MKLAGMLVLAGAVALSGAQALAQSQDERFNSVDLQAEAQREVANDTFNAVLFAEVNDTDAARLAATLNRTTNDALAVAKQVKEVRTRSGNNQTYPVYDRQQRLTGWRGRAELRLESQDFQAAAALIGKLQPQMQLQGIQFSVSPAQRKSAEDQLISEAIKAFRSRADIVTAALGGRSYRIRHISINSAGAFPLPRPYLARAAAAAEAVAPPLEGGTSQITLSVNGSIEVQ